MKFLRSLHQKKFRNEAGLFIVEGRKMVEEAIKSNFKIHSIYTTDKDWNGGYPDTIAIGSKEMDSLSTLNTPAGYLAVVFQPESKEIVASDDFIFVLDGINDPGNLGTIIRTADWFGVKTLLCTADTVEVYNPKVVQSTMGSIFNVNVHYQTTQFITDWCSRNGYVLTGADMTGQDLFEISFPKKTAMVIGSESHGLRQEIKGSIGQFIHIPGKGKAESLNAAVAASIMVSQWFRTRKNE